MNYLGDIKNDKELLESNGEILIYGTGGTERKYIVICSIIRKTEI